MTQKEKSFFLAEPVEPEFSDNSEKTVINQERCEEQIQKGFSPDELKHAFFMYNYEADEKKRKKKKKKLKKKHSKLKKKYKKLRNELSACKLRLDEVEKSRDYQMKLFFNNGQWVSFRKGDNND